MQSIINSPNIPMKVQNIQSSESVWIFILPILSSAWTMMLDWSKLTETFRTAITFNLPACLRPLIVFTSIRFRPKPGIRRTYSTTTASSWVGVLQNIEVKTNKYHVWMTFDRKYWSIIIIPLLIISGNLIGYTILLPAKEVWGLATKNTSAGSSIV